MSINISDDCISRQEAIDAMWKALYAYEDLTEKQFIEHQELKLEDWFRHRIFVQRMHEECMKSVESLPPLEPKRPKGEWKYGKGNGECPFCGRERQRGWDNYCGYCGARMRK